MFCQQTAFNTCPCVATETAGCLAKPDRSDWRVADPDAALAALCDDAPLTAADAAVDSPESEGGAADASTQQPTATDSGRLQPAGASRAAVLADSWPMLARGRGGAYLLYQSLFLLDDCSHLKSLLDCLQNL